MKKCFSNFRFIAAVILITQQVVIHAQGQLFMEVTNLQGLELKGPVYSVTFRGLCQGQISTPFIADSSVCSEVYQFTRSGWMSHFATYNKHGDCTKRISVEYTFGDMIRQYVSAQFRDTMRYEAVYDIDGKMTAYAWTKNGYPYESAVIGPRNKSNSWDVTVYEKGVLTKEVIQTFNEKELLISEQIKELSTGKIIVHTITYLDSLIVSEEGLETEVHNQYDTEKRLIHAKTTHKLGSMEAFYTYDDAGRLIVMIYKEEGKMPDKYVFKYNQEGLVSHAELFLDDYVLMSITDMTYDEQGRLVKEISIDNVGTLSEKKFESTFVYDHYDNWIENKVVVSMSGMSAESTIFRTIEYY